MRPDLLSPGQAGSGEQITDRGRQDADRVPLVDRAGPDLGGTDTDERDAGGDQPGDRRVGAEGSVGTAARLQEP